MGIYDNQFYRPGYTPTPLTTPATPQPQQGILWTQGESGAKAWMLPPNSTILLMDADAPKFYIKTTDASGMPTMRVFEYKEKSTPQIPIEADQSKEYCTKEDFTKLSAKCDALETIIKDLTKPKKVPPKKEVDDE